MMNFVILPLVTQSQLYAYGFLGVLGLLAVVGAIIAVKAMLDQRRYTTATLPTMGDADKEEPWEASETEKSAFALDSLQGETLESEELLKTRKLNKKQQEKLERKAAEDDALVFTETYEEEEIELPDPFSFSSPTEFEPAKPELSFNEDDDERVDYTPVETPNSSYVVTDDFASSYDEASQASVEPDSPNVNDDKPITVEPNSETVEKAIENTPTFDPTPTFNDTPTFAPSEADDESTSEEGGRRKLFSKRMENPVAKVEKPETDEKPAYVGRRVKQITNEESE